MVFFWKGSFSRKLREEQRPRKSLRRWNMCSIAFASWFTFRRKQSVQISKDFFIYPENIISFFQSSHSTAYFSFCFNSACVSVNTLRNVCCAVSVIDFEKEQLSQLYHKMKEQNSVCPERQMFQKSAPRLAPREVQFARYCLLMRQGLKQLNFSLSLSLYFAVQ